MKDYRKGFSPKRVEDHAKTADVVQRAREVSNAAVSASRDLLNTPGAGREIV